MLDFKLENDLVILRREFAAEYRSRRWGKLAALRKYSDSKKYFPPEYMPEFAYQSCIVLEHGYTIKFFGVV